MQRKYVAEYPPKLGAEGLPPIYSVLVAGSKPEAIEMALPKFRELREQGLRYLKPKIRLFKSPMDNHLEQWDIEDKAGVAAETADIAEGLEAAASIASAAIAEAADIEPANDTGTIDAPPGSVDACASLSGRPNFDEIASDPGGAHSLFDDIHELEITDPTILGSADPERPTGTTEDKPSYTVEMIDHLTSMLFPGEVMRLEGIPEDVYRQSKGLSSTALKHYWNCAADYKAYSDGLIDSSEAYFAIGTATHCKILEPEKFDNLFRAVPEGIGNKNSKAFKELQAQNPGVTYFCGSEWRVITKMSEEISSKYGHYFSQGAAEVSYWKMDPLGVLIKCRCDYERGDLIVDLKTVKSSKPAFFNKSYNELNYWLQDAMYRDITGKNDFLLVASEKKKAFIPTIHRLCNEHRELAYNGYRQALNGVIKCDLEQRWPGYLEDNQLSELTLSPFVINKITENEF